METAIELSEYEVQANDFASKYGVSLKVISHRFGSMAWDKDGQKRNIFKLKLERGEKSYSFDFGSSVSDSCEKTIVSKWDALKESDSFEVYCGVKNDKLGYVSIKFNLTKENASLVSDDQIKEWVVKFDIQMDLAITKYDAKKPKWEHAYNNSKYRSENFVRSAIERTIKKLQNDTETVYLNPKKEVVSPSLYTVLSCLTKYDPGTFEDFCSDFGYDTDSRSAHKTYKEVIKEWNAVDSLFGDVLEELQEMQ